MTTTETYTPRKFSREQVQPFWAAVEECLNVFHGVPRDRAGQLVRDAWQEHDGRNQPYGDILYHDEPFRIAAGLAGSHLELTEEPFPRYDEILEKHGW